MTSKCKDGLEHDIFYNYEQGYHCCKCGLSKDTIGALID